MSSLGPNRKIYLYQAHLAGIYYILWKNDEAKHIKLQASIKLIINGFKLNEKKPEDTDDSFMFDLPRGGSTYMR